MARIAMDVIGFTGSQKGMTPKARQSLYDLFMKVNGVDFHHGDCVGSDEQAHHLASSLQYSIAIHPPENDEKRAFCQPTLDGRMFPAKDYLDRNQDIVDASTYLMATPNSYKERRRGSGTWATIRRARKKGIRISIIYPNGIVNEEAATGGK